MRWRNVEQARVVGIILLLLTLSEAEMKKVGGDSIPIIYSSHYNLSILGIEHFHPFDSKKYRKVYKGIINNQEICPSQFYQPEMVTDSELLQVHTAEYLSSLNKSRVIAGIVEISALRILPGFILRNGILNPMRYATGGTILGVRLALKYGWAINL